MKKHAVGKKEINTLLHSSPSSKLELRQQTPSPHPQTLLPEKPVFRVGELILIVQPPPLCEKLRLVGGEWPARPLRQNRKTWGLRTIEQIQRRIHPPNLISVTGWAQALASTEAPVVLAIRVQQDSRPNVSPKPRRAEIDAKPVPPQSLRCFNQTALLAVVSEAPETVVAILHLAGAVAGISSPGHAHGTLFFVELMCRACAAALHLPPVFDAFLETISTVQLAEFVLQRGREKGKRRLHTSWNLHQHTSRAILSPVWNSSKQMTHSASLPSSSTQSFSVAMYGNMPRAA